MDRHFFDAWTRRATRRFRVLSCLLALSLAGNLAQTVTQPSSTTILLPARINGPYEIGRDRFDRQWLADASAEVATLMFNVTPETGEWRRERVLRWAHPAGRQALIARLDAEQASIRDNKLSMALSVRGVSVASVDEGRDSVTAGVEAVLTRWMAGREVARVPVTITLTWRHDARGAPMLTALDWEERQR